MACKYGRLSYQFHGQNIPWMASLRTAFSTTPGSSHIISHLNYFSDLPTRFSAFTSLPCLLSTQSSLEPFKNLNMSILYVKTLAPLSFKADAFCWSQVLPPLAPITLWPHLMLLFLFHAPLRPYSPPYCFLNTPGLLLPQWLRTHSSLFSQISIWLVPSPPSAPCSNVTGETFFPWTILFKIALCPQRPAPSISYFPSLLYSSPLHLSDLCIWVTIWFSP